MWSPAQHQIARQWQVRDRTCRLAAVHQLSSPGTSPEPGETRGPVLLAPPATPTLARALAACQVQWEGAQRRAGL